MFIVKITNAGGDYFMRRSIWTGDIDRADRFATREAAQTALTSNRKFTKPAMFKAARVVEVN
jgi:hypothetical protein